MSAEESRRVDQVVLRVRKHPAIPGLRLIGSRSTGTAGPLSDWDFLIETADPQPVTAALPRLVEPIGPLAAFFDPLSRRATFIVIIPGPVKIDLITDTPREPEPARDPSIDSLPAIDQHFWDWTLWLAGKKLNGRSDLVTAELAKMYDFLLVPLGATGVPTNLSEAVRRYVEARGQIERAAGRSIPRALGEEVQSALVAHGVL